MSTRMTRWEGIRRKVFISFDGADSAAVTKFVNWAESQRVLIPRLLLTGYNGAAVNSSDPGYVMDVIRRDYLDDTTVTLLMMGTCTHSRRYVDWELKASLRQGSVYTPNGVLAVNLSPTTKSLHLPPRFHDNFRQDGTGDARWYPAPTYATELGSWIEDAYQARVKRQHLIVNAKDMMTNNAKCRHCGITHPAG